MSPGLDRRLATGGVELILNLAQDRPGEPDRSLRPAMPNAVVVGPSSRWLALDRAQQRHVVGASLLPGAATTLLGVSAHELADRTVALEDLWGLAGGQLRERALTAPTARARLLVLERALQDRARTGAGGAHPLLAPALALLSARPTVRVRALGAALGWTPRRLEQVFRTDVGLTPAAYRRLQRFRSALARIDRAQAIGWTAFALDHGYCDQPHLIREFRAHCGLSPSGLVQARRPSINHIQLAG